MSSFLTNHKGGYLLLDIKSRYRGFFVKIQDKMIKILEDLPTKVKHTLPHGKNALILESKEFFPLSLDIKESYDNDEFGRIYEIREDKKGIVINFKKENTDLKIVVVLAGNFKTEKIDKWKKKIYEFDKKRNSFPYERWIYEPLKIKGKVILGIGKNEQEAWKEIRNLKNYKAQPASTGLLQLLVEKEQKGIYAGLPWFFQFWSRDELISLRALMLTKKQKIAKEILFRNLKAIAKDGRLPNQTLPLSDKTNADGIGWLFKRIQDYKRFTPAENKLITNRLEYSINKINKNYKRNGLIYNNPLETWMDTEWEGDVRDGFCIEIQCLFLNMLKLAYVLTRKDKYLKQEEEMKKLVRDDFWNGEILADRLDDFTKRPNIYIAAYIYPELLTRDEWTTCFKNITPSLWLSWGGLSTIDKKHPLYTKTHTGEITQSYHRGDSWFWINNLAALVMKRANSKELGKYISGIVRASKKEFKKLGIKNQHAELSSASKLESNGCLAQAWSDAFLAELIYEL